MRPFKTGQGDFTLSNAGHKHVTVFRTATGIDDPTQDHAEQVRRKIAQLVDQRHAEHALADKSDPDPEGNPLISGSERKLLRAADHVHNLHSAARFMAGKPLSSVGLTHLDEVHGQSITSECGCVRHLVFNHYDQAPEPTPHRVHVACGDHAHLAHDAHVHHRQLIAEAKAKADKASEG